MLEALGASFVRPAADLAARVQRIRALVFDWDGVFNRGEKGAEGASGFNEADSMGVNMLRYALWRRDGTLPAIAIITGERNASAEQLARREHFDVLYQGIKDKQLAIAQFRTRHALEWAEIACTFDDINDLAMATECGVRIFVRRRASALFTDYVMGHDYCDYVTASESGQCAVREAAELMLGLSGQLAPVIASRRAHDEEYEAYFAARQAVETAVVAAEALR